MAIPGLEMIPTWAIIIYPFLIIWCIVWKGLGLWRAAKRKSKIWFIILLILNTVGILPIIYLIITRKKQKTLKKKKTKK